MAVAMIRVLEYHERFGRSPWRRWFNDLGAIAAAKVGTALYRFGQGNFSTVEAWEDYKQRRRKGAA